MEDLLRKFLERLGRGRSALLFDQQNVPWRCRPSQRVQVGVLGFCLSFAWLDWIWSREFLKIMMLPTMVSRNHTIWKLVQRSYVPSDCCRREISADCTYL
jgi:hypothetical protein